jgi:ParB-like chromosome segregation protein Spo0J
MPKVQCAHTKMVPIGKLKVHPKNPNRHTEQQVAMLAKIILELGWRHPIIVSNRSGFIVAGHARLEAAKLLSETQVPVDYQDFESNEQEMSYLLADNKIAELAEMDNSLLKDILKDLEGKIDLDLTGFDTGEIQKLIAEPTYPDDVDVKPEKPTTGTKGSESSASSGEPSAPEGPPERTQHEDGEHIVCPHCGGEIIL